MLKKTPDSDPLAPKSYRPISLLPVLGKGLERVLCDRLTNEISHQLNNNQFGFMKGKSTADAIRNLLGWHQRRIEKHKLVVMLDISGAFDNLKWSILHEDLEALGCPDYIRAIFPREPPH